MIPSFIYRNKLDLDDYFRGEEGYDIVYYGLDQLNWLPTLWSSLLCYGGPYLLPILGALLGWIVACVDNWIWRTYSVTAFVAGIWLSSIPLFFEWGFSGVVNNLRGLLALVIGIWLARFVYRPRGRKSSVPETGDLILVREIEFEPNIGGPGISQLPGGNSRVGTSPLGARWIASRIQNARAELDWVIFPPRICQTK